VVARDYEFGFSKCGSIDQSACLFQDRNARDIAVTKIVAESNVFISFGLAFERKQIPRFVGNVSS
jgi:hypothetical protein